MTKICSHPEKNCIFLDTDLRKCWKTPRYGICALRISDGNKTDKQEKGDDNGKWKEKDNRGR